MTEEDATFEEKVQQELEELRAVARVLRHGGKATSAWAIQESCDRIEALLDAQPKVVGYVLLEDVSYYRESSPTFFRNAGGVAALVEINPTKEATE